jgi:hypothetical protein
LQLQFGLASSRLKPYLAFDQTGLLRQEQPIMSASVQSLSMTGLEYHGEGQI